MAWGKSPLVGANPQGGNRGAFHSEYCGVAMPLLINVTYTGIDQISDRLRALGGADPALRAQAFTTVLSGLGERLVEELKAVTPVGVTGHLRDQTSYEVSVGVQERQDIVYTLSVIQA